MITVRHAGFKQQSLMNDILIAIRIHWNISTIEYLYIACFIGIQVLNSDSQSLLTDRSYFKIKTHSNALFKDRWFLSVKFLIN